MACSWRVMELPNDESHGGPDGRIPLITCDHVTPGLALHTQATPRSRYRKGPGTCIEVQAQAAA